MSLILRRQLLYSATKLIALLPLILFLPLQPLGQPQVLVSQPLFAHQQPSDFLPVAL
ncbi:hypothetical protein EUX98_g7229 [Antrodiella citrinella]|uniref:Uncharacterized protein n=1 Tax=Antrodiella citrinella TaxID=2447956 RepID=A0A4S4MPG8_9APHY|nr:hypothetical protein EUX98_g7229 [Antrodiella citrinella]